MKIVSGCECCSGKGSREGNARNCWTNKVGEKEGRANEDGRRAVREEQKANEDGQKAKGQERKANVIERKKSKEWRKSSGEE
jgi:hypothetical protein